MDEVDGWAQAVGWGSPDFHGVADEYERPSSVTQEVQSKDPQALENNDTDDTIILATHPVNPDSKAATMAGLKRKVSRQRSSSRVVA
jgi:hypothetical protein